MEEIKNKKQCFINWLNHQVKNSDINEEWGAFNAVIEKFNEVFENYVDLDVLQKSNYNLVKKCVDNLNAENVLNMMLSYVSDLILNQMRFNSTTTELTYDEYYRGLVVGIGGLLAQIMSYCSMKNLPIARLFDDLEKANTELWKKDILEEQTIRLPDDEKLKIV